MPVLPRSSACFGDVIKLGGHGTIVLGSRLSTTSRHQEAVKAIRTICAVGGKGRSQIA